MSPTRRSLKLMRERGYLCYVTERWNAFAHIRQDMFGFIDILAMRDDELVAVQTTSGSNVSARIEKIKALPAAWMWKTPTRKIVVHGWRKAGARGKRKQWECREVEL